MNTIRGGGCAGEIRQTLGGACPKSLKNPDLVHFTVHIYIYIYIYICVCVCVSE